MNDSYHDTAIGFLKTKFEDKEHQTWRWEQAESEIEEKPKLKSRIKVV